VESYNMPAKSAKQYRFMQMIAHSRGKKRTKGAGPSPEVARKFIEETPPEKRSQFARRKR
jgi:hypothetical protein